MKIHIVVVDDDGRDAAAVDVVVAVCDEHLTSHCLRFFWMVSDVDFDDVSWSKMILIQELRLVLHLAPARGEGIAYRTADPLVQCRHWRW